MTLAPRRDLDADNLYSLARDRSPESRTTLAHQVFALFESGTGTLSDREKSLMSDILTKLISDMEFAVRRDFSELLSRSDKVPPELAVALAYDRHDIARPMLLNSSFLNDAELIDLVRHRALEHQLSIALRPTISEQVSDALVETGNESVISSLLHNHGAQLSAATTEYLVEESRRVDSYQEPIVNRPELSRDLAIRMCTWVSKALREDIFQKFAIDVAELEAPVTDVVDRVTSDNSKQDGEASKSDALAQRLQDSGKLTINMLISLLNEGQVAVAISGLGKLTGIDDDFVKRALFDPWGDALAIMLRAVAANKDHLSLIYNLVHNARSPGRQAPPEELQDLLEMFAVTTQAAAGQIVRQWSRCPDYASAVRDLDSRSGRNG
jgi:uncharacterized protein (DUF2336 family)